MEIVLNAIHHMTPENAPAPPPGVSSAEWLQYLYELISEDAAADFNGQKTRTLQDKRQKGGEPKFVRISSRCVKYRRIDLIEYANEKLRQSTSDTGEAA